MSFEIRSAILVVILKCAAAYHDDAMASSRPAAMTSQAFCEQKAIVRTTIEVMIFMMGGTNRQREDEWQPRPSNFREWGGPTKANSPSSQAAGAVAILTRIRGAGGNLDSDQKKMALAGLVSQGRT